MNEANICKAKRKIFFFAMLVEIYRKAQHLSELFVFSVNTPINNALFRAPSRRLR